MASKSLGVYSLSILALISKVCSKLNKYTTIMPLALTKTVKCNKCNHHNNHQGNWNKMRPSRVCVCSGGVGVGGGGRVPVSLFPWNISAFSLVPQNQNHNFLCSMLPKITFVPLFTSFLDLCSPEINGIIPLFPITPGRASMRQVHLVDFPPFLQGDNIYDFLYFTPISFCKKIYSKRRTVPIRPFFSEGR